MTQRWQLGVAARAKIAGLGVVAAVTLAVASMPATALASDGDAVAPAQEETTQADLTETLASAKERGPADAVATVPAANGEAPSGSGEPGDCVEPQAARGGALGPDSMPTSDKSAVSNSTGTDAAKANPHDEAADLGGAPASQNAESREATPSGSGDSAVSPADDGSESQSKSGSAGSTTQSNAGSPSLPAGDSDSLSASAAPHAQVGGTRTPVTSATVVTATVASSAPSHTINVLRMYNPNSGEHFYTSNEGEALYLFNVGWRWEGVSYKADAQAGKAVYRLYNPNAGNHFYTTDKAESDHVAAVGWNYEGIAWYAIGNTLLYRLYNPNDGTHVYTTSVSERDNVRRAGWNDEGTAWSVLSGYIPLANTSSHMVYSGAYGSYERYWIASDAQIARGRIVPNSESHVGYAVYATSSGALARNRHVAVAQVVYSAGNDGRLTMATNLRGIDIASYQAGMNTANVDADFVIVKATQGTSYTNPYMRAQADGAYNSGKLLGFYHYASTDFGGGNPVAEADHFVQQVGPYAGKALLVLDWEGIENSNFGRNDAWYVKTFLDRVYQRTGVRGVVYMSRSATSAADYSSVANAGYGLWVAQYLYYNGRSEYPNYVSSPMTTHSSTTWQRGMTGAWSSPALYQYTSKGHVSGYSGELDLNVFYQDSSAWTRMASRA